MAKREFDEIRCKIDKILELSNNTNVRLSVVETKINYINSMMDAKDKSLDKFIDETKEKRKCYEEHFDKIDNELSKGQGAIWLIAFAGTVVGLLAGAWGLLSGFFR